MNALIYIDGMDATGQCLLEHTRLEYDSTRVITSAAITVISQTRAYQLAKYDTAVYDTDRYGIDVKELMPVQILDGRDGTTKLFAGQVYKIDHTQTDAPGLPILMTCTLLDYASWLDRAVCLNTPALVFPCTDQFIIQTLVNTWSPNIDTSNVLAVMSPFQSYDYIGKTCRQVLDDLAKFSNAEWRVDFSGKLYYNRVGDAPQAPFQLSTAPDMTTSFPVRIDSYAKDFTNPVNHCYAAGKIDPSTGATPSATYSDPVSIQQYGQYDFAIIDDQITNANDAQLRAQTTVLKYAYPIEQGSFTIWKDGLLLGQQVHIHDNALGIDGWYIIRSLALSWRDQNVVEYKASFGSAQPQLEAYLRLIDQQQRWRSQKVSAGIPTPGSVTDASIAAGGLSASVINSVNASTIVGSISAGQIGSVNAGAIIGQISAGQISTVSAASIQGQITASQIGTVNATSITGQVQATQIGGVNATTIQGAITAGQIGSVNATVIQGVVISSQLADGIIDNLAKYATALQPVQMLSAFPTLPNKNNPPNSYFYNSATGHFYQVAANGTSYTDAGTDPDSLSGIMQFYSIGALNAKDITGLILAAQIQSIQATQITGSIQAAQIAAVNASSITGQLVSTQIASVTAGSITGQLTASQIASVTASTIQGTLTAVQIGAVNATVIQGQLTAGQIAAVNASSITGTITNTQIGSVNAATITIGLIGANQIGSVNAATLNVGGVSAQTISVYDSGGTNVIGRIGVMTGGTYGGWFKVFGAGGNDYTSAKVYTDTGGNLFINNANLSVTDGTSTISTSPTKFDASYSSLALVNADSVGSTSFVSRGLVFYAGTTKIGSLVKSPGGSYLELECTVGGAYVLINGSIGVRSDAGYRVASTPVINSSAQWVGPAISNIVLPSSISISGSMTANSGYWIGGTQCITSGGVFTGLGVNVGSYGVTCGGVNPYGGYTGQTYTVAFHDNSGNALQLWLNGTNYGQIQLRFVGGIFVGTA